MSEKKVVVVELPLTQEQVDAASAAARAAISNPGSAGAFDAIVVAVSTPIPTCDKVETVGYGTRIWDGVGGRFACGSPSAPSGVITKEPYVRCADNDPYVRRADMDAQVAERDLKIAMLERELARVKGLLPQG